MIQLNENTVVQVRQGRYSPYLAIGQKADSIKYDWVFMSKTSVKAIDPHKIDSFFEIKERRLMQLSPNEYVKVSEFRGKEYLSFIHKEVHGESNGHLWNWNVINLVRKEWQQLTEHLPPLIEQLG